jgi:hypothetical protein
MSFTIVPVSESYAPPAVIESERPHDRQHEPQNPNRRRHPHQPIEIPSSADKPVPPAAPRTIGTLIDIRADGAFRCDRILTIGSRPIASPPPMGGASL